MNNSITLEIEGHAYRITTLDARLTQELLDYAKKEMPDPVQQVLETAERLPEKHREAFYSKHLDQAFERAKLRGTLTDPDLESFLTSPKGVGKTFSLMFRKHHPHLTEDQSLDLVGKAIAQHGEHAFKSLWATGNKVPVTENELNRRYLRPGESQANAAENARPTCEGSE